MSARTLENLRKRYNSSAPARGPRRHGPGSMSGAKPKNAGDTIKRVLGYVGAYKKRLVLVFIAMISSTLAQLAASYMMRPIVNAITNVGTTPLQKAGLLAALVGVMGAAYLIGILGTYVQSRLMIGISQNALEKIRNDLFGKLQRLPVRFFDTHSNGELMSRFTNDVDNIGIMLDSSITSMISGLISLVSTLAIMLYVNVWLTLITVLFIPVFALAARTLMKLSRKYYAQQQAALGAVNGYIEENVSGQKVVKVFNHEDTCVEEFGLLNDDLRAKQINAQFFGGLTGPIIGNAGQMSYAVTAGVGGLLCVLRSFDVGGLAIFVNYSRRFSRPVSELAQQISTIMAALAGAERVFEIMDLEPEEAKPPAGHLPQPASGYVRMEDVSFGYDPDRPVLKHISLYAKPGQKIAFVGSTGAGKTTVTNLLTRFYDVQEGTITIDGIDIRDIPRSELRSHIAMVLQDTHLFTGTVRENIRYGRLDATDEEVETAARMASADGFIRRLANGYDTVIEGDGANLSQGQRQLLNIARAAVSKAPILILDEATSSVDTRTERLIEKGMDRLMQDRTTFVIAHRLSTVRNANAIMVIENGEIIERGDNDELLKAGGRYHELYMGLTTLT
ncbi:MAG: ABC transporter ATP-binding protein [Clostridia bacterium]|nr:ABC transporter ATP-binding protein [Clostridia bacterium]